MILSLFVLAVHCNAQTTIPSSDVQALIDDLQHNQVPKTRLIDELERQPLQPVIFDRLLDEATKTGVASPGFNRYFRSMVPNANGEILNRLANGSPAQQAIILNQIKANGFEASSIVQAMVDRGGDLRKKAEAIVNANPSLRSSINFHLPPPPPASIAPNQRHAATQMPKAVGLVLYVLSGIDILLAVVTVWGLTRAAANNHAFDISPPELLPLRNLLQNAYKTATRTATLLIVSTIIQGVGTLISMGIAGVTPRSSALVGMFLLWLMPLLAGIGILGWGTAVDARKSKAFDATMFFIFAGSTSLVLLVAIFGTTITMVKDPRHALSSGGIAGVAFEGITLTVAVMAIVAMCKALLGPPRPASAFEVLPLADRASPTAPPY